MDASTLIRQKQDQAVYVWYRDKATLGQKQPTVVTNDIVIEKNLGSYPLYYNYQQVGNNCCVSCAPTTTNCGSTYTLDEAIFLTLDSVLQSVAAQNLGPTRGSRILYLWFLTIVSAFSWASQDGAISGTKDSWNWDLHYPLPEGEKDMFFWMNQVLSEIMPTFVPSFDTQALLFKGANVLGMNIQEYTTESNRVRQIGRFSDWKSAWTTWYTARQNDGFVAASAVPADSDLPNGSQTMEVTTTTDDPNTFSNPQKWVPLRINGSKKNYLTFGWGDVTSTGLTSSQQTTILDSIQTYFPGTASSYNDGSTRANEIAEVVTLTGTLTDVQKMIAEFWAGGPFTVSPPCMFLWLWRYYMAATNLAHVSGFGKFFYSGLDLAIHLFETGRLVWQLKKNNFQARPIQEVRRMYRGQSLTKWDGTSVLGEAWTPYQETNFVTPPFPDFPSGHSAFSQSFANVMTDWFGSSISRDSIFMESLVLLSPIFSKGQTQPFGTFTIPAKSSNIQTGVVPSTDLTFTYPTWQSMADEAGLSRKYGGIHATSAHTSSQALANQLHPQLQISWNILKV